MKLIELTQTSSRCPAQWDGRLEDGRPVYIRFRGGVLSVEIGQPNTTYLEHWRDWELWFEADWLDPDYQDMTIEQVCALTHLTLAENLSPYTP